MPGTLEEAGTRLAALEIEPEEVVADKGYHSNATMKGLKTSGLRGYVSEPDRGRRNWTRDPDAQNPTYANRRRIRGARGKRLLRRRGEILERAFCASSGDRRAAPCACAGAGEHPQAHAGSCGGLQSRITDAQPIRIRDSASYAGTCNCASRTGETGGRGCNLACHSPDNPLSARFSVENATIMEFEC